MAEPRSLFYYDRSPSAWLERTAGLSVTARAAYADLEGQAWTAPKRGAPPCSLPDDDVALARLARLELREWRKVAAEVRALYVPEDGLLIDAPMLAKWTAAHDRYTRRVEAGAKGNEAQGKGTAPIASRNASPNASPNGTRNASRNAHALHTQLELEQEGEAPVPSGHGGFSSASADALAPGGARDGDAGRAGDYLDRPSVRDELLKRGVRLGEAPLAPDVEALHAAEATRGLWEARYDASIGNAARVWLARHREEAGQLESEQRRILGLPVDRDLSRFQGDALRAAMVAAVAKLKRWPSCDDWIVLQAQKQQESVESLESLTPSGAEP